MRKVISLVLAIAMVMSLATVAFAAGFTDVKAGKYYSEAVEWASSEGIINGILGTTEFQPDKGCTRGQFVTMLYRYAGKPAVENTTTSFTDVKAGAYYYDAMLWAVENGITTGLTATTFGPEEVCTRGQVVTFLYRYAGEPEYTTANSFSDVKAKKYCYDAVQWASENEIVLGIAGKNEYQPDASCLRGQIATILYRYYNYDRATTVNYIEDIETPYVTDVNAGETRIYGGKLTGTIMTIADAEGAVVILDETKYEAVDGVITVEFPTSGNIHEFTITNGTDADAEYSLSFAYPLGSMMNPAELVIGENSATVKAGVAAGYYFQWTANEEGELTITMDEANENGWSFTIYNLSTYAITEIINSDNGNTASIAVSEGDKVQVNVNTYDSDNVYNPPAGTVTFTASLGDDGVVSEAADATATVEKPITFEYTPEVDGTLSVTISGNPGYKIYVFKPDDSTVGLPQSSNKGTEQTLNYELEAGVTYTVRIVGYADWEEGTASVTYSAVFTPAEGGDEVVEKAEYEISDTQLVLGENKLTQLETAETTIYEFVPTTNGLYKFTVSSTDAKLGDWNSLTFPMDKTENKTNVLEASVTTGVWKDIIESSTGEVVNTEFAAPSIMVGVSGVEGEFVLTVELVEEYGEYEEVEYVMYENTHTFPEGFNNLTGEEELVSVDLDLYYEAVLGEDGYYHLDEADGPILYVDLETTAFPVSQALGYGVTEDGSVIQGATTLRGVLTGEDGEKLYYDFMTSIRGYYPYLDANGVYPLTEDLMLFLKGYGAHQGWYNPDYSPFKDIADGEFCEATAWMALCRYVPAAVEEEENVPVALTLGDNNVAIAAADTDGSVYTYTAEKDGTLNIEVTTLSHQDASTGEWTEYSASLLPWMFSRYNVILDINGNILNSTNTYSIDVVTGDVVTMTMTEANGTAIKGTMNLSYADESEGPEAGGEIVWDGETLNTVAIASYGYESIHYTATEAGTVVITIADDVSTDWCYYIDVLNENGWPSYVNGNMHYSDDTGDSYIVSDSVACEAGQTVEIYIATNSWGAGNVSFYVQFIPAT